MSSDRSPEAVREHGWRDAIDRRENASAAQCTRTCVKSGSEFALVSGDKLYILKGDKSRLDKFAGDEVVVNGELNGNSVTVRGIKAAH